MLKKILLSIIIFTCAIFSNLFSHNIMNLYFTNIMKDNFIIRLVSALFIILIFVLTQCSEVIKIANNKIKY